MLWALVTKQIFYQNPDLDSWIQETAATIFLLVLFLQSQGLGGDFILKIFVHKQNKVNTMVIDHCEFILLYLFTCQQFV